MSFRERSDDIVIRIPRKMYTREVQNMLNLFKHKKIVSNSKVTEKEVKKILGDIKKERVKKVKQLLKKRGITGK
jgi:ABC-type histidine transport system ATPase subunit